ncbi:hypothetical protein AOLI_G00188180 [Acnodon oligacanthus]
MMVQNRRALPDPPTAAQWSLSPRVAAFGTAGHDLFYREKSCSSNMTSEESHSSVPAASPLSLQIGSGRFTDQCERVKLQEGLGGAEVGCGSPCWTICLTDSMVDLQLLWSGETPQHTSTHITYREMNHFLLFNKVNN